MQIQLLDRRLTSFEKEVGNAGYDLQAVAYFVNNNRILLSQDSPEDETIYSTSLTIFAGETIKIGTGVKVWIEHPDLFGAIFARSKLGTNNGIVPANCVGVVDSSYQGEVIVALTNHSDDAYTIKPMDKIAQLILLPFVNPTFEVVQEFSLTSGRGSKGILCDEERR